MSQKIVKTRIWKQIIGTTPTQILAENPDREAFRILNLSAVNIELLSSPAQSYGDGYRIAAGDEYINKESNAAFWLVAESGTADVRLEEDSA